VDADLDGSARTWAALGELVDLNEVGELLESQGVASFIAAFDELLAVLDHKRETLG
jgi:hypothetical protein